MKIIYPLTIPTIPPPSASIYYMKNMTQCQGTEIGIYTSAPQAIGLGKGEWEGG